MEDYTWQEAIRKRPGMYLGMINQRGYIGLMKSIISELLVATNSDNVDLKFIGKNEGIIRIKNVSKSIKSDFATIKKGYATKIELPVFNAFSSEFKIEFIGSDYPNQIFSKGQINKGIDVENINCSEIFIWYRLDLSIWGDSFRWKTNYISYELREFTYLNSKVRFNMIEETEFSANANSYHFKNGIADRLEIEMYNGHGECYFQHHIIENFENFQFEVAFAFREYTVDQGFIRTFVNNEVTPEHGTHLDGVLSGLTYGVMKYFKANELTDEYKISEKGMKDGLLCIINLKMEQAVFSGCVKNKLANPEIIEPIANLISDKLYTSIRNDDESTQKIIDKFQTKGS